MSRKALGWLREAVREGQVVLSAGKGEAFFEKKTDAFGVIRVYRREEPRFEFGQDYEE